MSAERLACILKSLSIPEYPIAFSGGLDSAILASLTETSLFSVGLAGSYDIENSKKAAALLGREVSAIEVTEEEVLAAVPEVITLVGDIPLDLEIGTPFYLLLKKTRPQGLVLGQGADELFGGYKRYGQWAGTARLARELKRDSDQLPAVLELRERSIARAFGTELSFPYLDSRIAQFAENLPASEKVSWNGRKLVLRDAARKLGLPEEICSQPKKAIQYGTGISKLVRKNLKEIVGS